jgi:hypothetical protein
MILLFPGNAKAVKKAARRFDPDHHGWLLTANRTMTRSDTHGLRYGIDNDCFSDRFDPAAYTRALVRIARHHGPDRCLFAPAPDVLADALATLRRFDQWEPIIRSAGLPVALVAQDGLEQLDIPWDRFDCLFVGGTTAWKMGEHAAAIMYQAQQRRKWLHVGRVSSWQRVDELRVKPDSIDGTHWTKRPDKYTALWERIRKERLLQRPFPFYEEVPTWQP